MEKIESFKIDHTKLLPGLYVSRKDRFGDETLTTFDIRMKRPNYCVELSTKAMHTIEHLAATFIRNNEEWGKKVIYFGPMGCLTGFYLILAGDYESADVADVVLKMFQYIAHFEGHVPGATRRECGNYLHHDLKTARWEAKRYCEDVLSELNDNNTKYAI